jgi:heme exporter protein C
MKNNWWKILAVVLLTYTIYFGLMGEVPRRAILNESIRNVYFHVPMWFAMILMLCISVWSALKYLRTNDLQHDTRSVEFTNVAILLGVLGCATGALWARVTWGDWWPNDPKLNSVAICMLMYFAYLILRSSFEDEQRRARVSAVYNILAFAVFIPLIFILPRLTDSLHPGNGGNPAFSEYDMNSQMRRIFYPAVIGWMLLGGWIATLRVRIRAVEEQMNEQGV